MAHLVILSVVYIFLSVVLYVQASTWFPLYVSVALFVVSITLLRAAWLVYKGIPFTIFGIRVGYKK